MKVFIAAISMIFAMAIAACTPTQQGAAIGGLGGAAVGAAVSGDVGGAVIGGAAGAIAGGLIGRASEGGMCRYRDQYGREYTARCPAGY